MTSPTRKLALNTGFGVGLFLAVSGSTNLLVLAQPAATPTNPTAVRRGSGSHSTGGFDVREFGATGNKKDMDTAAIQRAIDAAADAGGGTVYFPAGDFLSATLVLKSHVAVHLSTGATLWASPHIEAYGPKHLLYAQNADDIAIEGGGAINGQGELFKGPDHKALPYSRIPIPLIRLVNCRDVRIQDVRILGAPGWTIHPKNCDRVKIRGITIQNDRKRPVTDGIVPDSCRNVVISDCIIEAGDDCIVLKTTRQDDETLPCENVAVTNCILTSSASAIKLGTESHGDFRNCVFANCVIRGSRTGIALIANDGGIMEGIRFSNISIESQPQFGVGVEWPIVIGIQKRNQHSRLSRVRDVSFSDISISTRGRVMVSGHEESPVDGVTFRNVHVTITGSEDVATARPVPNTPGENATVPAALIFTQVKNATLTDLRISWNSPEPLADRHAFFGDRLESLRLFGFTARQSDLHGKCSVIYLKNSKDIVLHGNRAEPGTGDFLHLDGVNASEVWMETNDLRHARRAPPP